MITGNKTLSTRYILPFLFDCKDIFSDKYLFINAYIADINRPWLEDNIFIVFEYNTTVYNTLNRAITNNSYYYDNRFITINNKLYIEYIFVIPKTFKNSISLIKEGYFNDLTSTDKSRIISFWSNTDLSYLKQLLEPINDLADVKSLEERKEIVTEEDYVEDSNTLGLQRLFA